MSVNCFDPQPIVISNERVRLEPLQLEHASGLYEAGRHEDLWRYLPCEMQEHVDETRTWINDALSEQEKGTQLPFTIFGAATDQVIGSTRYLDIRREDRNVEIGWTWLTPGVHGSAVNPECKLLLMQHAFETLGAVRVQLKCDERNLRSQRAMEKLGFVREGVLRRTRICWDGHIRNTVYYSVLDDEWPRVKQTIQSFILK
ncbi:MAG: GNAT family protein [Candidatus Hinthialibacter antarcticus]|nr:GNAT family protein [Candidatus Hinthialibacter antarcticus]